MRKRRRRTRGRAMRRRPRRRLRRLQARRLKRRQKRRRRLQRPPCHRVLRRPGRWRNRRRLKPSRLRAAAQCVTPQPPPRLQAQRAAEGRGPPSDGEAQCGLAHARPARPRASPCFGPSHPQSLPHLRSSSPIASSRSLRRAHHCSRRHAPSSHHRAQQRSRPPALASPTPRHRPLLRGHSLRSQVALQQRARSG